MFWETRRDGALQYAPWKGTPTDILSSTRFTPSVSSTSIRRALRWSAEGELAEALREHASSVAGEVLATGFEEGLEGAAPTHTDRGLGLSFTLTRSAQ